MGSEFLILMFCFFPYFLPSELLMHLSPTV
jgi:hypothetical protein